MATPASYVGRKVDLSVMSSTPDGSTGIATLNFSDPSRVVTGVQKTVQQWTTFFLTRRGTVLSDPEYGTDFLADAEGANLSTDSVIQDTFNNASTQLREWFQQTVNQETLEDDEVIVLTELTSFSFSQGLLTLNVRLTTRAGSTYSFIAPIPVKPITGSS